jgi:hypothetical protein
MKPLLAVALVLTIGCNRPAEPHKPWAGDTQPPNYPIINAAPEPEDPEDQAARLARSRSRNQAAARFDQAASTADLPESSDTVVVGTVLKEQPYFSEDHAALYTEYIVAVENLLRNLPKRKLSPTGHITVVRKGGALRQPDGKVVQSNFTDVAGPLTLNRRYVLFLRYDKNLDWYALDKVWELRDGVVVPADRQSKTSTHSGEKEADFLDFFVKHEVRPATPPAVPPTPK